MIYNKLKFFYWRKHSNFFMGKNSQTWVNDHFWTTTTILESRFPHLENKVNSEQQPPVNNGHYFWVPRVVVVHRFDCIQTRFQNFFLNISNDCWTNRVSGSKKFVSNIYFLLITFLCNRRRWGWWIDQVYNLTNIFSSHRTW